MANVTDIIHCGAAHIDLDLPRLYRSEDFLFLGHGVVDFQHKQLL